MAAAGYKFLDFSGNKIEETKYFTENQMGMPIYLKEAWAIYQAIHIRYIPFLITWQSGNYNLVGYGTRKN